MAWQQLRLHTAHPDFAEEVLEARGAISVSILPAEGEEDILEPAPGATPKWRQTTVEALFAEDADLTPVRAALAELLPDAGSAPRPETGTLGDSDWVRICLDEMQAMRFGQRLWVCPHHREVGDADAVVVKLDPGLAFGTGTHPTTALCLRWLDAADLTGARVLDYGCGSGILAVAALKLGAASVTAVDNDPQALRATAANARDNGVEARLSVHAPGAFAQLPEANGSFDIVLANILAAPLIALAPRLMAAAAPGAWLVLAGLLDRQATEVVRAYPGVAWQSAAQEGWTRLAGHRPASPAT